MVSNDYSREEVNVTLVIENRKPVFFLDCPSCECQSLICVACIDVFHKENINVHFLELMVKKLGFAAKTLFLCNVQPLLLVVLVSWLGCTAEVLTVLLHFARATLSLMARPGWMYFSLLSLYLSLTPGKSGFLCRNHREHLKVSFPHEIGRQTRSFTSRNGICWYSPSADIDF